MRRKNRRIYVTVDIPEACKDEEDFMYELADLMDEEGWCLGGEDVTVSKVQLGDIIIEPEDEKEE